MPEKKSIGSGLIATAVAKVKEGKSFQGKWGVGEHLACHRYVAMDAIAQAQANEAKAKEHNAKPENKDKQVQILPLPQAVNELLKKAFAADPEMAYASNFQKLLMKSGEIVEANEYE